MLYVYPVTGTDGTSVIGELITQSAANPLTQISPGNYLLGTGFVYPQTIVVGTSTVSGLFVSGQAL